jgi:tight adherence protein C
MLGTLESLLAGYGLGLDVLPVAGVAIGAMIAVIGLAGAFQGRDPALRRIAAEAGRARPGSADRGILKTFDDAPSGLMKGLIPTDEKARTRVAQSLAAAGFTGAHAVRNYYLVRLVLGILLPVGVVALILASQKGIFVLPERLDLAVNGLGQLHLMQGLALVVGIGFFGPELWLRSRVAERKRRISEAFPNALDLIQISAEAGLGFDAAMIRVGNEIAQIAPDLSAELLLAQREIQAGRARDRALLDMAARTGVDEVAAFVNVVLQSIQFGTSISGTLSAYAKEMRLAREIKAQEKANKLPVQMSAFMASLMLPALLILTLGPVVIRYMRYFSG